MVTQAPTVETIGGLRRDLRRERQELSERRGPLALRVAGGDETARQELRQLTESLEIVDRSLDDLSAAEIELANQIEVTRREESSVRRGQLAVQLRAARESLGTELVSAETAMGELSDVLRRVRAGADVVDVLTSQYTGQPTNVASATAGVRIAGRLRSIMATSWPAVLPGVADRRPLTVDDVV